MTTSSLLVARALYDYEAQQPTEISVAAGDVLHIVQRRDDGWTLCRTAQGDGLIPTSYGREKEGGREGAKWGDRGGR